jgi:predicted nucleic acid-binding protein
MGLILDSSVVIAGEREGQSAAELLADIRVAFGAEAIAFATVSVIELEHGIWRAKDAVQAECRQKFFDDLFAAVPAYPLTFDIARRAARIDGVSGLGDRSDGARV